MPITITDAPDTLPAAGKKLFVGAFTEVELFITKASLHEDGTMRWLCTASDTGADNRHDHTTIQLFRDWIRRVEDDVPTSFLPPPRMPFLGLSHYPSLDGFGEGGESDRLYEDGNQFKAGGTFFDRKLGREMFTAVREELAAIKRGDVPDLPIRISAAWWDIEHAHGDFIFRRRDLDEVCPMCLESSSKTFLKGQLDHFAATRVPINPRTFLGLEERSMAVTRKEDAASIVSAELAEELEEKAKERMQQRSEAGDKTDSPALVVKAAEADPPGAEDADETLEAGGEGPDDGGVIEEPALEEQAAKKKKDDWKLSKTDIKKLISTIDKELARRKKTKEKKASVELAMKPVNDGMSLERLVANLFESCPSRKGKTKSEWFGAVGKWVGTAATNSITGYRRRLVMVGTKMGMTFPKKTKADVLEEQQTAETVEVYRPFGGATSIGDAEDWMDTQDRMYQMYDSWSLFRAVVENILDDDELEDKVAAVRKAISEFGDRVDTIKSEATDAFLARAIVVEQGEAKMTEKTKDEEQVVQAEETPLAVPIGGGDALDPGADFWNAVDALADDVTLSRAEMLERAQNAMDTLAQATHNRINQARPPEAGGEEMKAMVEQAVTAAVGPLAEKVALLVARSQAATAPATPVQKSMIPPVSQGYAAVNTQPQGAISDIGALARRSVGLPA